MFVFVYFTKRHTAIFLQLAVLHCIILYDCAKDQWELRRKRGGGEAREEPDLHICPTHTIPTLSDLSLTYCMVLPTHTMSSYYIRHISDTSPYLSRPHHTHETALCMS